MSETRGRVGAGKKVHYIVNSYVPDTYASACDAYNPYPINRVRYTEETVDCGRCLKLTGRR